MEADNAVFHGRVVGLGDVVSTSNNACISSKSCSPTGHESGQSQWESHNIMAILGELGRIGTANKLANTQVYPLSDRLTRFLPQSIAAKSFSSWQPIAMQASL